jgi:trimeric autotransporter adhesin
MKTLSRGLLLSVLLLLWARPLAHGATFTVINTNASGAGSLWQAIADANASPGADRIEFQIATTPKVIFTTNALPTITEPVEIIGFNLPNLERVEVNGQRTGSGTDGFRVAATNTTINGLAIYRFPGAGIIFFGGSNRVDDCWIGHAGGTTSQPNGQGGVFITNSAMNVVTRSSIAGNSQHGVRIANAGASNNIVAENRIGARPVGVSGSPVLANSTDGIHLNGAPNNLVSNNVIVANSNDGVELNAANANVIVANYIGGTLDGAAFANGAHGINLNNNARSNRIGGVVASERNVIAFNNQDGVTVAAGTNNAIRANSIFSNGDLGIDLANNGVTANDPGDSDSGANLLQNFPVLTSATNTAAGLIVFGTLNSRPNASYAIDFFSNVAHDPSTNGEGQFYLGSTNITTGADSNASFTFTLPLAMGRFISATATDTNGNTSEFSRSIRPESTLEPLTFTVVNTNDSGPGSLRQAILDNNGSVTSNRNTIAFAIPGSGPHVISPLSQLPALLESVAIDGLTQSGASANTLSNGNNAVLKIQLLGLQAGSGVDGLKLTRARHFVRGLSIVGFNGDGIEVSTNGSATIEGCFIGADFSGTNAIANGGHGIYISAVSENVVGGVMPSARNVISGNGQNGVHITGITAVNNAVLGNFIGTDASGTSYLGNGGDGVQINNASDNAIGADYDGAGNLISGNNNDGVEITGASSTWNFVARNRIGTDVSGLLPLGNNQHGVAFSSNARSNLIGFINATNGNRIAYNNGNGVHTGSNGTNNAVRFNSIARNAGLGIDLGNNNSVTANDAGDTDSGANLLQNFPVITNGVLNPASTDIAGHLNSRANASFVLDFFASQTADPSGYGEGDQYLGSANVTTDASGNAVFSVSFPVVAAGRHLTATATDTNGNTSEFSAAFAAASTLPPITLTVVNTSDSGPGSLRQAMLDADAHPAGSANRIHFNIPGAGPHVITPLSALPTNRQPVAIDGYTQPGSTTNSLTDGFNASIRIKLDGASISGFGVGALRLEAGHSSVRGIAFTRWTNRDAIIINSTSNVVAGCLLGIDTDGTSRPASTAVVILGSVGNEIGGLTPGDRNVVSYNTIGIAILSSASSNNIVRGNFIGTDFTGTQARGNSTGVDINGASFNVIGGAQPGARNVISGNFNRGIRIQSQDGIALNNVIQGNHIGTDVTATLRLGNSSDGILNSGFGTVIGGATAGARNIIGANGNWGIDLAPNSGFAVVQGNWIGIGAGGVALSNTVAGVAVSSSSNQIGGAMPGEGNVIAYNRNQGVIVAGGTANSVRANSIFANNAPFGAGLGIDVGFDGINANDVGDADTGVNNRQNFPVVTAASGGSSSITVSGTLNSAANSTFAIDVFANVLCDASGNGEGQQYLGSTTASTDSSGNATWNATFNVGAIGRFVTATATDAQGNSSEFSPCFNATLDNQAVTFTVVNTNDSGAGSLRQAILDANAAPSSQNHIIAFNIPGSGVRAIKLLSPLPPFVQPVTIDGFTQPGASANTLSNGNNASWLVELRGIGASFNEQTLRLTIAGLAVRGLRLTASAGDAIEMVSSNCVVEGCFIYSNASGGIVLQGGQANRIGGTLAAQRNIISGHGGSRAIEISASHGNTILGNHIGPDAAGGSSLGTQFQGVNIFAGNGNVIGDGTHSGANVIAFHSAGGVFIQSGTNNSVRGNRVFQSLIAIDLGFSDVTPNDLGDTDEGANRLQNFPVLTNAVLQPNGTLVQGTLNSAPNTTFTLDIYSNTNCGSGSGEAQAYLGSGTVTTDGSGNGVFSITVPLTANARFITATATDPNGNTSEFSACVRAGSTIPPLTFTVVNTNDSGPGSLRQAMLDASSVISGGRHLIRFSIAQTGLVTIVLDSPLPSPAEAVEVDGFTQTNSMSNSATETDNAVRLIRIAPRNSGYAAFHFITPGHLVRGLEIKGQFAPAIELASDNNVLEGNFVSGAIGHGVIVSRSANLIGGATIAKRNIISGNAGQGIFINGISARANLIQGNFIGADATGQFGLPNGGAGVRIDSASFNVIGGGEATRNIIGGNNGAGVHIFSSAAVSNRVEGNYIGVSTLGSNLGSLGGGVILDGARFTVIGEPRGSAAMAAAKAVPFDVTGVRNMIAFNSFDGVHVASGTNNTIRANRIFSNGHLGIDLSPDGVNVNDTTDNDTGANFKQNFPIITNAAFSGSNVLVSGMLQSRPNTTYELDFFLNVNCDVSLHGEGQYYLSSAFVTTDLGGNAYFTLQVPGTGVGTYVTSTATDPHGNTSEFSPCAQGLYDSPMTFVVTNANDSGEGSLRQAIDNSNNRPNPQKNTVNFNIPGAGDKRIELQSPLPTVTQPVVINGLSQPGATPNTATNDNNADLAIALAGLLESTNALVIEAPGTEVRGLEIEGFRGGAILIGPSGDDSLVAGSIFSGNGAGVEVREATGVQIGGAILSENNTFTDNAAGIVLRGGDSCDIVGNVIGGNDGSLLKQGAGVSILGGSTLAIGNTVRGNTFNNNTTGIRIEAGGNGTVIQGNAVQNGPAEDILSEISHAIDIKGGSGTIIGGPAVGAGNEFKLPVRVEPLADIFFEQNRFAFPPNAPEWVLIKSDRPESIQLNSVTRPQPNTFQVSGVAEGVSPGTFIVEWEALDSATSTDPLTLTPLARTPFTVNEDGTFVVNFTTVEEPAAITLIAPGPNGTLLPLPRAISTGIQPIADLSVVIVDQTDPVFAGGQVRHVVRVRNQGSTPANNVFLLHRFSGMNGTAAALAGTPGITVSGQTVRCEIGSIPANSTVERTLTFAPVGTGVVLGEATVIADQADPTPAEASESTDVVTSINLSRLNRANGTGDLEIKGSPYGGFTLQARNQFGSGSWSSFNFGNLPESGQTTVPLTGLSGPSRFFQARTFEGFDICVKNDKGSGDILINSKTGEFRLSGSILLPGVRLGRITRQGQEIDLHYENLDDSVHVHIDLSTNSARVQVRSIDPGGGALMPLTMTEEFVDSDITNNNCP